MKCPDCGFEQGTFACKIRHIQVNTGDAKAGSDRPPRRARRDIETTA